MTPRLVCEIFRFIEANRSKQRTKIMDWLFISLIVAPIVLGLAIFGLFVWFGITLNRVTKDEG